MTLPWSRPKLPGPDDASALAAEIATYEAESVGSAAVPTRWTDPAGNLLTLLRLAARSGLVLVDLLIDKVYRPAPRTPIGVKVGDGTRLGALTYAQARLPEDGSFAFEYRDGAESHFGTILRGSGEVLKMMWAGVNDEPTWKEQAIWDRMKF